MIEIQPSQNVFASPSLTVGRFRCPPGHPLWRSENRSDEPPTVVFPRVPVRISQAGRPSVVADANCVMFYNSGQVYTRGLLTDRGDACEYFSVSADVILSILEEFDPSVHDRPTAPFPAPNGPSEARTYFRQRRLFEYAASAKPADPIYVQEQLFEILRSVLATAFRKERAAGGARRAETRRCHADVGEDTKALLGRQFRERLLLEDIAKLVHVAPYHLCRIFRAHTGLSMHGYIDQLRLRASLEALRDDEVELTSLALDLGYSSHAHFTYAFRRRFGLTPSAVRRERAIPRLAAKQARF